MLASRGISSTSNCYQPQMNLLLLLEIVTSELLGLQLFLWFIIQDASKQKKYFLVRFKTSICRNCRTSWSLSWAQRADPWPRSRTSTSPRASRLSRREDISSRRMNSWSKKILVVSFYTIVPVGSLEQFISRSSNTFIQINGVTFLLDLLKSAKILPHITIRATWEYTSLRALAGWQLYQSHILFNHVL